VLAVLFLISHRIEQAAEKLYERVVPTKKFPIGSKERRVKVNMMAERTFRLFVYSAFTGVGFWQMRQSGFLHTLLGGTTWEPKYYVNYPCQKLPPYQEEFYIVKLAYHVYELLNVAIYLRHRRDFTEITLHHVMTCVLVGYSYSTGLIPIGAAIMLIMDCSDIFISCFKMTVDVFSSDFAQAPGYISMLVSWLYLRIYIFPVYLIWELYYQAGHTGNPV
jgi:hypothetical protein